MCGIAGYCLNKPIQPRSQELENLLQPIRKRGPDDEGICLISREQNSHQFYRTDRTHSSLKAIAHINASEGMNHDIAFLHTRFSILDLSQKGHQPFMSQDGSVIAIFNGEIYNYIEIRQELASLGVEFTSQSDTEVLVEGYAKWKDALWPKMNGFWSVVIYDRRHHSMVFCRDRMGIAPLYYRETPRGIYFSSYIESLIEIDGQKARLNEDSILGYVQTGYKDIQESTFYEGIKSLPAGCVFSLFQTKGGLSQAESNRYWAFPSQRLQEKDISFSQAVKEFRTIFFNAVDIRLRADVKIAFELSGGLDSSSVVAAAALLNKNKITTYTIKLKGADEEPYARSMLRKYNLDYQVLEHMEDYFSRDCASFSKLMEEPYDNPNNYTHHQMLKIMKSHGINVVVTGAGGDEVFAGYEASFWPKAYQEWKSDSFFSYLKADWYEVCRRYRTLKKAKTTVGNYFLAVLKKLSPGGRSVDEQHLDNKTTTLNYQAQYNKLSFDEQRSFHFSVALLPYYMRSSDHYTMGVPIEHRFPLLDYRLVEFGMRLPISFLFRNGWTKYILRKAMEPYLPGKIIWRRQKMGFQFPFRSYLENENKVFGPLLEEFYKFYPPMRVYGGYAGLVRQNPVFLWRLLSIGIWLKGLEL